MSTTNLTPHNLRQFTGSETFYVNPLFRKYRYTEGVQYLGANGAGWLVTDILAYQLHPAIKQYVSQDDFQLWKLTVNLEDQSAVLACEDGNCKTIFTQTYDYTDFPLPELKLYLCNNVLMLTSEY